MNWGQLLRIYIMIAGVSSISLFVFAAQFSEPLFSIASVAVGTIALISVILGFLLSANKYLDRTAVDQNAASRE